MRIKVVFRRILNPRFYFVFIFFILILLLLIARLIFIQVFKSAQLKVLADEQHSIYTQIPPIRGAIFDRKFNCLTLDTISYSIFATKQAQAQQGLNQIQEGDTLKAKLALLLKMDSSYLSAKLDSGRNFVWLKRKVSSEISAQIKELNLPGIDQVREYKRFYPNGSLASHILGFTDIDNKGLEGVELYYDSYLAGVKGWRLAQRDAKRQEIICWGYKSILPTDGYNLVLSIDSVIQNITQRQLREAAIKYRALSASAIVMEPKSGEILALANYPDYDANNFVDYEERERRDISVTDVFEPGSSFKFVTACAALEEKKVKLEDKFYCENGQYHISGRILHDYRPYGVLTLKGIIEHSSNIGMAKVAQLLDAPTLYRYIKAFGFGELTGIDLPGEAKGVIRPPRLWSKLSLSSIPIGQEISVTPIQLICAISCIANDGILVKPKIVKSIYYKDGQIIKTVPTQNVRRVISPETARAIKEALTAVVENGTGKNAQVPGFKTAGKTGTAQKPRPEGGYYTNKFFSSFIGFVPADNPRIAILILFNDPHPEYFGGTVACPVFREIATETLNYLRMTDELLKKTIAYETKSAD